MGSFFRSEEMSLCQVFVQAETLYETVAKLGDLGIVQFKDLNHDVISHQLKYVAEVRRVAEIERRLEVIRSELLKDEVDIPEADEATHYPSSRDINDLEAVIEKCELEINELSENFSQLAETQRSFLEYRCVLDKVEVFFEEGAPSLSYKNDDNQQLHFVAGIVDAEKFQGLERMLWRISMGNVFIRHAMIEEPFKAYKSASETYKIVFIVFFQGDTLKSKVAKICDGFHASKYPCSNDVDERSEIMRSLKIKLADMETVVNQTKDHRQRVLNQAALSLNGWSVKIKKLKAIYATMNMFSVDVSNKCLIGECWTPTCDVQALRDALESGSKASNSTNSSFANVIAFRGTPPTLNRTNKFTRVFQTLIDSYGVSTYREVNPAFYAVITFPFLFSVMFGDVGHGIILALFGFWMVKSEKKLDKNKGEIFQLFLAGRYVILLMGIFAIYSGFIYNDIFAKSMNIFGSSWRVNYNVSTVIGDTSKFQLNPSSDDLMTDRTYPLGVDPVWQVAENKILFLNSFKMKMSIVLGMGHMLLGLTISCFNYSQFRQKSSIWLEYLPRIIFLLLLFGYLVFMMFFKWIMFTPKSEQRYSPGCAPSILVHFINMMLFNKNKGLPDCEADMYSDQRFVQMTFVAVALLCVPWMLAGKPLFVKFTRSRRAAVKSEENFDVQHLNEEEQEEEPMSEIWMHQAIHTIEYVLGTISHTASYLRLWALSLAHAQLSEVLWNKLLHLGLMPIPYVGPVILFYIFIVWSSLTVGILVVIEGLSAFLHTLRLHWVEFMDKFYDGNGIKFEPFCFEAILNRED